MNIKRLFQPHLNAAQRRRPAKDDVPKSKCEFTFSGLKCSRSC